MTAVMRRFSIWRGFFWLLTIIWACVAVYRFSMGLGAATNLSDGYPWGLWIGFDVLSFIALAGGGFVMAGTIHLFGGHRLHALSRLAILVGLVGYTLYGVGLMADLGRPWMIWRVITNWHRQSPMFEVSWCVMLYTFVLWMEFAPVILEKIGKPGLKGAWKQLAPWAVIAMLTIFIYAMTYSAPWAMLMLVILLVWEGLMRAGIMPRDAQVPILLIMAGVILSTLHQSSLGSLMLIVPHKLHPLWYTPIIPLLFLFSAITNAPAIVMFAGLMSERFLGKKVPFDAIGKVARAMPYLLGIYLLLKMADLVGRGAVEHAFILNAQSVSWWGEITIGVIFPLVLFMTPEVVRSRTGLALASILVPIGLIWNRFNYAMVGIIVREWEVTYFPSWMEILFTFGLVAMAVLVFDWAMRNMNIIEESGHGAAV